MKVIKFFMLCISLSFVSQACASLQDIELKRLYIQLRSADAHARSEALRVLFIRDQETINNMALIYPQSAGLVCLGLVHENLGKKVSLNKFVFRQFQKGNFIFDDSPNAYITGKRLIIDTKTIPTSKEYASLKIPATNLPNQTDAKVAQDVSKKVDSKAKK